MAAVAYPVVQSPTAGGPRLVVAGRGQAGRPLAGSRPGRAICRRRRAVVLALIAAGVALAWLALRAATAGPGGGPLTATGTSSPRTAPPAATPVHLVQPGDTLWSIVRGMTGSGDPRPEVDLLEHQLHGRPILAGQRLVLP
jgi:hypothetical protein